MNSQWVGIGLSVLVMLGGTAVNLFIIGRFVGQWGEAMKNIAAMLAKVEERVEEVDGRVGEVGDGAEVTAGRLALVDQRLVTAEQAAAKFWDMREEFISMRVTVELSGKSTTELIASLGRSMSVIERQMGNLVASRAGFTTIETKDPAR